MEGDCGLTPSHPQPWGPGLGATGIAAFAKSTNCNTVWFISEESQTCEGSHQQTKLGTQQLQLPITVTIFYFKMRSATSL